MTILDQIAHLYIKYHHLRKEIADAKYSRCIDFKPCEMDENPCYNVQKLHGNYDMCPSCQANWNAHLDIVKLGRQAGGIKYSLGKLIEKI